MNQKLKEKILESLSAVLPVTGIVMLTGIILVPVKLDIMVMFLTGAVLPAIGMGFFQLGAEMSMTPLGERVGVQIAKTRMIALIVLTGFLWVLLLQFQSLICRCWHSRCRPFPIMS